MHVLFLLLVLAFAGLLWATVAIAQHIRQAQRCKPGLKISAPLSPAPLPVAASQSKAPMPTAHLIHSKQLQISL